MVAALPSACCASVATADSTSSRARVDCGLNSLLSSEANSLVSLVSTATWPTFSSCASLMTSLALGGLIRRLGVLGQGLEQVLVVQDLVDQLFSAALAVHVRDQVGELLARLEQLGQRRHLLGDRGRREILEALELHLERDLAFTGQLVRHAHLHGRGDALQPLVEVVDRDFEELAIDDRRQLLARVAG